MIVDIFTPQFTHEVWRFWISMILLLVAIMVGMNMVVRWIHHEERYSPYYFDTPYDILSWTFGLISQQGFEQLPKYMSTRIVYLFGFFFGMLCFLAFQANIVTTFTTTEVIQDIHQLIQYSLDTKNIIIYPSIFPPFSAYLKRSQNPLIRRFWNFYTTGMLHKVISKPK